MRLRAAFLTGHSVRGCTGLSPLQRDFQVRTSLGAAHWLPHNFPYEPTFPFPGDFPLLLASLNNLWHYGSSRLEVFRRRHRPSVEAAFGDLDRVLVVAGSCGLELLDNLQLPLDVRTRLHVLALGPVSRGVPEVARLVRVQGHRDWLSRWFHPQVEHRVPGGHMDYLARPEVLGHFEDLLADVREGR